MFKLIHSQNFWVRLSKDQPRDLEEDLFIIGVKDCLGNVHLRRKSMRRVWIDGALIPSVKKQLEILNNVPFGSVSELIDKEQHGRRKDSSTHTRAVGQGLICEGLTLLHVFISSQLSN